MKKANNNKNLVYKKYKDFEIRKLQEEVKEVAELEKDIYKIYNKMNKQIEKTINEIYIQEADKEGKINQDYLNRKAKKNTISSFKQEVNKYIKQVEAENDENYLLLGDLYAISKKRIISDVDEKLFEIDKSIDEGYEKATKGISKLLMATVASCYAKNKYMEYKLTNQLKNVKLENKNLEYVLKNTWNGSSYTDKMYSNQSKLKKIVRQEVAKGIVQGSNAHKVTRAVQKRIDTDYKYCKIRVNTEHSHVMKEANRLSMEEANVKYYQFVCTLDERTCDVCSSLDMEVFKLSDMASGVNASPMHESCRCTEVPYFDDEEDTRFARDSEGNRAEVASTMNYDEWADKYVK